MTDWRGQTVDGPYAALLEGHVLRDLDGLCRKAGTSETGGVLIGRYSDDLSMAIVREATPPPPDSRRGRSWFVRGVSGLRDLLNTKWRAKERTYYVGEWHFHPVDHIEPSAEDFSQMLKIGRAKEYDCREPLLVIFGTDRRDGRRSFRVFVCPADRTPMELLPKTANAEDIDVATDGAS